jgi:surface antigen
MRAGARRYRSDAVLGEALKIAAAGLLALSTGACSFSYAIVGMKDDDPVTTGSIAARPPSPLSPDLNQEDWRRARAALAVALDPQGAGTPVSWDNPGTSRKGNFAPASPPFVRNDEICRSFTGQLGGAASGSFEGTACRPSGGEWAITDVGPAKAAARS